MVQEIILEHKVSRLCYFVAYLGPLVAHFQQSASLTLQKLRNCEGQ